MTKTVTITVFRYAGQKWFLRIRNECAECDLTVGQVKRWLSAHPDWPVRLAIKPWLNHLWESLRHGGWHAPVVVINGKLLTQGRVPTRLELERAVEQALASNPRRRRGWWQGLAKRLPPVPS